jgi:competence ComEA-like helix-hairpin-helix protein
MKIDLASACRTLPVSRCRILIVTLAIVLACVSAASANKKPPLRPVNLNAATALELQQVSGIGPSTADKILKMRKSYGPFKSVDDLRAIKGIGPKRMESTLRSVRSHRKNQRAAGQLHRPRQPLPSPRRMSLRVRIRRPHLNPNQPPSPQFQIKTARLRRPLQKQKRTEQKLAWVSVPIVAR